MAGSTLKDNALYQYNAALHCSPVVAGLMAVSRQALYCSTAAEPEVAPADQPQTVVEGLL